MLNKCQNKLKKTCQSAKNLTWVLPLPSYAGRPAEGACELVIITQNAAKKDIFMFSRTGDTVVSLVIPWYLLQHMVFKVIPSAWSFPAKGTDWHCSGTFPCNVTARFLPFRWWEHLKPWKRSRYNTRLCLPLVLFQFDWCTSPVAQWETQLQVHRHRSSWVCFPWEHCQVHPALKGKKYMVLNLLKTLVNKLY